MKEKKKKVRGTLYKCDSCGYDGGFHVFFQKTELKKILIKLKCPMCKQTFDINWEMS